MQLSLEKQCASVLYANEPMDTRLIKLDKKDIAYFQFILEGYEGLATATTIDKNRAVVKIFIAPGCAPEIDNILKSLSSDISLEEIRYPEEYQ